MALQFNFDNIYGADVSSAYAKIEDVRITPEQYVTFTVKVYVSEQARTDNKQPIAHLSFNKSACNFSVSFEELYAYLKTLPEFNGAQDV